MNLIRTFGANLDQDTTSHPKVTGTFSRPAEAVAYTAGDIIANSGTPGAVVNQFDFDLDVDMD